MKVPTVLNPQRRAPQLSVGGIGSAGSPDAGAAIFEGVNALAGALERDKRQGEQDQTNLDKFELNKTYLEEVVASEERLKVATEQAGPGAADFAAVYNKNDEERHLQLLEEMRGYGYKSEELQVLDTNLAGLRVNHFEKALSFQNKEERSKAGADLDKSKLLLSQIYRANPHLTESIKARWNEMVDLAPYLSEAEKEDLRKGWDDIRTIGAKALLLSDRQLIIKELDPDGLYKREQVTRRQIATSVGAGAKYTGFQGVAGKVAEQFGLNPAELAAIMSFETGGSFSPTVTNKTGHMGLIQFGKAEQAKYKITKNSTPDQWARAIGQFFTDRGLKKGASIEDVYSTILTGSPGNYDRKDSNGTSVRNAVPRILSQHKRQAEAWLQEGALAEPVVVSSFAPDTRPASLAETVQDEIVVTGPKNRQFETSVAALNELDGNEQLSLLNSAYTAQEQEDRAIISAQEAAEREQQEARVNGLLNDLADGKAGQAAIDQARQAGWLTDYDDIKKAQGIIAAKEKDNSDLELYSMLYAAGGQANPFDPAVKDAVEAGVNHTIKWGQARGSTVSPLQTVMAIWQRTGVLAKQGEIMLRGGLASPDVNTVAATASVAANMLDQNPNAFAGVTGEEDIVKAASYYKDFIDVQGLTAREAAARVANMNNPDQKKIRMAKAPERDVFEKTLRGQDMNRVMNKALGNPSRGPVLNLFGTQQAAFATPSQKEEAEQTFAQIALSHFDEYFDPPAALSFAERQMSRFYGFNQGRIMKYPPSKSYPTVNGNWNYVREQAKEVADQHAGKEVDPQSIILEPIAVGGATAEAFRAGRPAPYQIIYTTTEDGVVKYNKVSRPFVADVGRAKRTVDNSARTLQQRSRQMRIDIENPPYRYEIP